ncbi:unnamed protein product [Lymnaea stagnalis]|uniref:Mitochondrial fission process protein 1 n=1 Tax=Lymnaea stagnalis TaxID=6523 RepID=A0AAV2IPU0_LYMST
MLPREDREYDVYKDSLLRYAGYANEVGEAFRLIVPVKFVWLSYAVSSGYVIADAIDKGYRVWKKPFQSEKARFRRATIATCDTLIWQGLASVIIPGFTINRICWLANRGLSMIEKFPPPARKWTVAAIGLGSIPFIVKPIDRSVDFLMDNTFRRLYYR